MSDDLALGAPTTFQRRERTYCCNSGTTAGLDEVIPDRPGHAQCGLCHRILRLRKLRTIPFHGPVSTKKTSSPKEDGAAAQARQERQARLEREEKKRKDRGAPRLEDGIELRCCGQPCKLAGNLALRGAGSPTTRLAYECTCCHRRLQIIDEWGHPSAEQLAIYDETP